MRKLCWLSLLLVTCQPPDQTLEQEALMQRRLADRLEKYHFDEMAKCKLDLLEEASFEADSILRVTHPIKIEIDTIIRPPKPDKPSKPGFTRPTDSVSLRPIIEGDSVGQ